MTKCEKTGGENLRHRVVLEAPSGAPDGSGGIGLIWSSVATLWAEVRAMSGGEQLTYGRVNSSQMNKIVIRHRTDLTTEMRFSLDGRVFEIRRISDPDGRKRWLECFCEERPQ